MRRPNRELNVFNMSALDLFASAMGVFLLLALIALPYYRKIEPEVIEENRRLHAEVAAVREALAEEKKARAECETERESLRAKHARCEEARKASETRAENVEGRLKECEKRAAKVSREADKCAKALADVRLKKDLDLVLIMDTTGSMRDEINELRKSIASIVRILQKLAPGLRVGFVAYRDRGSDEAYLTRTFQLKPMNSSNLAALTRFIEKLEADGGGDNPEAIDEGVKKALEMSWRSAGPPQVMVVIGDAPVHDKNLSKLKAQVRKFIGAGSARKVSTVYTPVNDSDTTYRDFFRELASVGRGDFNVSRGQLMENLLLSIVE